VFGNFKFKPFKQFERQEKTQPKKTQFCRSKEQFFPPEGHSWTNLLAVAVQGQAQGDDTKKYFYIHGGA